MRLRPLTATTAALLTLGLMCPTTPFAADPRDPVPKQAEHHESTPRRVTTPTLTARATLSADYAAPGPSSGAQATPANGRTGPFDGQIIPGFSGMVANGDGTY